MCLVGNSACFYGTRIEYRTKFSTEKRENLEKRGGRCVPPYNTNGEIFFLINHLKGIGVDQPVIYTLPSSCNLPVRS